MRKAFQHMQKPFRIGSLQQVWLWRVLQEKIHHLRNLCYMVDSFVYAVGYFSIWDRFNLCVVLQRTTDYFALI